MSPELKTTNLFRWLKKRSERLATRVTAVRDEQSKWLPYIITVFPHFSGHGVEHSDRIVSQLSRLIFKSSTSGGNALAPVVGLSAAEAYCLLCSAYLHDMGMVVSPGTQSEILDSAAWQSFVAQGGKGHDGYLKYTLIRTNAQNENSDKAHFFADAALRHLIADFVRRDHHERAVTTLQMHDFLRQLVDDGDSVAFETIAAICAGHGLDDRDLADKERFPEERDVFGEKVNVRFLARLLRIGDLLDMDTRRTDPMSAKAVTPLPPDATPHWKQYSTKKHENVSPEEIAFRFECKDQDTHRVLRDWLGWLESEVRSTALGQMHARRHSNWPTPKCAVASQESHGEQATEDQATIIIRPAEGAAYAFHDWRMEVDQPAVLDLLINRVYDSPYMFVRELIQNALDATRCQMYSDFKRENPNIDPPDRPTRFRPEFRERYPLNLSLKKKLVQTAADEPPENRLVFSIEDSGTGMTEEIIKRYFLQVGRSYYKSAEFRKRYGFIPTSRFGVGFLSTFAVSNHITVETAHSHLETGQPRGIRLTLREPKNYLLTEPWTPFEERPVAARSGTRIQVVLDTWPEDLTLVELVRRFCVAVEVPVVVDEDGSKTVVGQMLWHDGEVLGSSKVDPKGRFVVRAFAVDTAGVEGQIAVLAYADENGEGWCHCWSHDVGLDGKAIEEPPSLGAGFEALHGIRAGSSTIRDYSGTDRSRWLSRLDLRGDERMVSLSRVHPAEDEGWPIPSRHAFERGREGPSKLKAVVSEVAQAAISEHLGKSTRAKGPRGIYYVGQVLSDAPVDDTWREEFPGTVVTWQSGKRVDISVTELLALGEIVIPAWCIPNHSRGDPIGPAKQLPKDRPLSTPVVSNSDWPRFAHGCIVNKLRSMSLVEVNTSDDMWYLHFSSAKTNPRLRRAHDNSFGWTACIKDLAVPSVTCDFLDPKGGDFYLLNTEHPTIQWLELLRNGVATGAAGLKAIEVEVMWHTAATAWFRCQDLIERWSRSTSVPAEFKPQIRKDGYPAYYTNMELYSRRTVRA